MKSSEGSDCLDSSAYQKAVLLDQRCIILSQIGALSKIQKALITNKKKVKSAIETSLFLCNQK